MTRTNALTRLGGPEAGGDVDLADRVGGGAEGSQWQCAARISNTRARLWRRFCLGMQRRYA